MSMVQRKKYSCWDNTSFTSVSYSVGGDVSLTEIKKQFEKSKIPWHLEVKEDYSDWRLPIIN